MLINRAHNTGSNSEPGDSENRPDAPTDGHNNRNKNRLAKKSLVGRSKSKFEFENFNVY